MNRWEAARNAHEGGGLQTDVSALIRAIARAANDVAAEGVPPSVLWRDLAIKALVARLADQCGLLDAEKDVGYAEMMGEVRAVCEENKRLIEKAGKNGGAFARAITKNMLKED